jgi:hypothetical protein
MSLTQTLQLSSKVEALELLVRRLVTDVVLKQADPAKALRSLRSVAEELGEDYDQRRQAKLLKSGKRAMTTSTALLAIIDEISRDVREEAMERQKPAA